MAAMVTTKEATWGAVLWRIPSKLPCSIKGWRMRLVDRTLQITRLRTPAVNLAEARLGAVSLYSVRLTDIGDKKNCSRVQARPSEDGLAGGNSGTRSSNLRCGMVGRRKSPLPRRRRHCPVAQLSGVA